MQTGDQIESQSETLSAMPVAFAQDAKNLQSANHIFNFYPFACSRPIDLLFCLTQAMQFAVLQWQNHFFGFALQAPITQIGTQSKMLAQTHTAQPEQFVVVGVTCAEKGRCNFSTFFGNNQLCLQSVPLALARIESALFFFGRSISLSVTSTIVYLMASASSSRFLPGRENFPERIKMSSILRTSLETFDSCNPQSLPKWNSVRYSRQKESVKRSWFSTDKLLLRPRRVCRLCSRATSHIAAKVSLPTPHKRLKSLGFMFLISS